MSEDNNIFRIVIVGGGPTGLAVAHYIAEKTDKLIRRIHITILEKCEKLGESGPFRTQHDIYQPCIGAQLLSFNISENFVSSQLSRLKSESSKLLLQCDDSLLSNSSERRQGWTRSGGQWCQYRILSGCNQANKFYHRILGDHLSKVTIYCSTYVESVSLLRTEKLTKYWSIRTNNVAEKYESDALILALPAAEISRILEPITPSLFHPNILRTVRNLASSYICRHSVLLLVSLNSLAGIALARKYFRNPIMDMRSKWEHWLDDSDLLVREIDVSNVSPFQITLLALIDKIRFHSDGNYSVKFEGAKTEANIDVGIQIDSDCNEGNAKNEGQFEALTEVFGRNGSETQENESNKQVRTIETVCESLIFSSAQTLLDQELEAAKTLPKAAEEEEKATLNESVFLRFAVHATSASALTKRSLAAWLLTWLEVKDTNTIILMSVSNTTTCSSSLSVSSTTTTPTISSSLPSPSLNLPVSTLSSTSNEVLNLVNEKSESPLSRYDADWIHVSSPVEEFPQAAFTDSPLSPLLRETKCIVASQGTVLYYTIPIIMIIISTILYSTTPIIIVTYYYYYYYYHHHHNCFYNRVLDKKSKLQIYIAFLFLNINTSIYMSNILIHFYTYLQY